MKNRTAIPGKTNAAALRAEKEHEKPMQLVRDGTTGRPVNMSDEDGEKGEEESRKEKNADLFKRQHDIDYLDIPSFLRTQAD